MKSWLAKNPDYALYRRVPVSTVAFYEPRVWILINDPSLTWSNVMAGLTQSPEVYSSRRYRWFEYGWAEFVKDLRKVCYYPYDVGDYVDVLMGPFCFHRNSFIRPVWDFPPQLILLPGGRKE